MSDERDLLLGELMADAVRAVDDGDRDGLEAALDAAGADRDELVDMVEAALLVRGPRTPDPAAIEALAGSPAFAVRAWPDILTDARHANGLQRSALVERLADALGVTGAEGIDRLRLRYHELETGLIDPRGVADSVADALGRLLGGIEQALEATRAVPAGPSLPSVAFQRSGETDALSMTAPPPLEEPATSAAEAEVDRLFGVS